MNAICLLLFSLVPFDGVVTDWVDIAELNHVLCPTNGNESGVYWVWWSWHRDFSDYVVRDWRPRSDVPWPENGVQEFWDAKTKTQRRIESRVCIETATLFDRESFDRKRFPEDRRRKLTTRERFP